MAYLTRTQASRNLPVERKGTKYVARAASHVKNGVPVIIAVRDMLKLANTTKEVKHMVRNKLIKINGKQVKDVKESVRLFNILEIDKKYMLSILHTRRFEFVEVKDDSRLCKVTNKKTLKNNKIQLNFHDGSNVISKDKVNVGDSVVLDSKGKISKIISLEKGKNIFVISGRSVGLGGKIKEVEGKKAKVKFNDFDKEVELDISHVVVR